MSVWIVAAASSAVWPRRSVQARVSVSPAVKKTISPTASKKSREDRLDSSPPSRNADASSGELRQLGFELQVEAARPVDEVDQRLRRQRLEVARQRAGVRASGLPASTWARTLLELLRLLAELRIARLRLRANPLEPLLDVVAVGDDELELELLRSRSGSESAKSRGRR